MKKDWLHFKKRHGFALIEPLLALALVAIFISISIPTIFYRTSGLHEEGTQRKAVSLAAEGLEAVRNLRDKNFANLTDGSYGLSTSTGTWLLNTESEIAEDGYVRTIAIESIDTDVKKITSTVSWEFGPELKSVSLETRLTNWR